MGRKSAPDRLYPRNLRQQKAKREQKTEAHRYAQKRHPRRGWGEGEESREAKQKATPPAALCLGVKDEPRPLLVCSATPWLHRGCWRGAPASLRGPF